MAVQKEYETSAQTITPTGLSGLIDGQVCARSADQTGGTYSHADFQFDDSSMTVTIGDLVAHIYIYREVVGTEEADAPSDNESLEPGPQHYVGSFFASDTISAAAIRIQAYDIEIPPGTFSVQIRNQSGETFDGTPTLKMRRWRYKDV